MDILEQIEDLRERIAAIDEEIALRWSQVEARSATVEARRAVPLPENLSIRDAERALMCAALARAPTITQAAKLVGLARPTFRYKAASYGIELPAARRGRPAKAAAPGGN